MLECVILFVVACINMATAVAETNDAALALTPAFNVSLSNEGKGLFVQPDRFERIDVNSIELLEQPVICDGGIVYG